MTFFQNTSNAGTALITANSGGTLLFAGSSTPRSATIVINPGGTFDISGMSSGVGITLNTLEGAGAYLLGSNALTVGVNNLDTQFSGTIADGGLFWWRRGIID